MAKHQAWELTQKQSLPLDIKIRMTEQRIRDWYDYFGGDVYVSFSGGKDSTVLLDICRRLFPNVEAVFVDTGLEYPEIRDFVKTKENVTCLHPVKWNRHTRKYERTNFRNVIKEHGYPVISKEVAECIEEARKGIANNNGTYTYRIQKLDGTAKQKNGSPSAFNIPQWKFLIDAPFKISTTCCKVMKKAPFHSFEKETGKKPFIATMASESRLRKKTWLSHGCNAFDKKTPSSQPMSFWTEQDVLTYLLTYNIEYSSVYGDIVEQNGKLKTTKCDRTGCMFCMFGCHLEAEPNRFQMMKKTHPKQYEYCMKSIEDGGLGLDEILTFLNVAH